MYNGNDRFIITWVKYTVNNHLDYKFSYMMILMLSIDEEIWYVNLHIFHFDLLWMSFWFDDYGKINGNKKNGKANVASILTLFEYRLENVFIIGNEKWQNHTYIKYITCIHNVHNIHNIHNIHTYIQIKA